MLFVLPSCYLNEVIHHACHMPMYNLLFNLIPEYVLYRSHMLSFSFVCITTRFVLKIDNLGLQHLAA